MQQVGRRRLEGHNDIMTQFGGKSITTISKREMHKLAHAFNTQFPQSKIAIDSTLQTKGSITLKVRGQVLGSVQADSGTLVNDIADLLLTHNEVRDVTVVAGTNLLVTWYHEINAVVAVDISGGATTKIKTVNEQATGDTIFRQGMPVVLTDDGMLEVYTINTTKPIIGVVSTEAPSIANDKVTVVMHGHMVIYGVAGAVLKAGIYVDCAGWDYQKDRPIVVAHTASKPIYGIVMDPSGAIGDEVEIIITNN